MAQVAHRLRFSRPESEVGALVWRLGRSTAVVRVGPVMAPLVDLRIDGLAVVQELTQIEQRNADGINQHHDHGVSRSASAGALLDAMSIPSKGFALPVSCTNLGVVDVPVFSM